MTSLWVALLLTAGDESVAVKNVKVKPPAEWQHTVEEGTDKWIAPSGEAYFTLDVGATAGKMTGAACVDKIAKAIGGKFAKLTVAKQPAGKKEEAAKDDDGKEFVTWTYVGCNGATTWSVQFHTLVDKKAEMQGVAGLVVNSIEYK
jgi:hypothetical protein